ncbi:MAG: non-ribosomal peptide synthetase, partial [bacterium]|nr:non-ribosomal peptide synthetase [bacterium]
LQKIVTDARPPVLLTLETQVKRFDTDSYDGKIICLDRDSEWETVDILLSAGAVECTPENAACIIYTSGSTGEPRGILIENRSIVNLLHSFMLSYEPRPGDRILPLTSIASASFVGEILPMLTSGGAMVLADKIHFLDIKQLVSILSEKAVTILSTVPSMIARLNGLEGGEWNPGKLRLLLSGGEALSAGDIDHLQDSVTIVNGYGLTEATICSTYTIVNEEKRDFSKDPVISVGKPVINTQVYILDRHMNPVPVGVPGEIWISGAGVAPGYLNNPEQTAQKFIVKSFSGGPGGRFFKKAPLVFRTGDLGSRLADGSIKFMGRIDTQVQVRGHRIELSEIETALGLHPDIRDVVVIDRELVPGDRGLVAYVVTGGENRREFSNSQVRDWLGERVPEYMIPPVFETLDTIPLNANGKVDVKALPVPSGLRPSLDVSFKAPQTEIESQIASIWQEFLHVEKVGVDDNFFDLGGHSLLLTQVHARLNKMYANRKELTIVDMFRYSTIHALAKFIGESETKQSPGNYKKIQARANKQRQVLGGQFSNRRRRK